MIWKNYLKMHLREVVTCKVLVASAIYYFYARSWLKCYQNLANKYHQIKN